MIGKSAGNMFNPDMRKSVLIENLSCHHCRRYAAHRIDAVVSGKGRLNAKLRPNCQKHGRYDQNPVVHIKCEIKAGHIMPPPLLSQTIAVLRMTAAQEIRPRHLFSAFWLHLAQNYRPLIAADNNKLFYICNRAGLFGKDSFCKT